MEQHLSQYKIFYEVAKAGNISKAAKELFISQPALSKSISKLEESLGITLFARNSRGVALTMEGEILYKHVAAGFESIILGEEQIKKIKEFNIGKLRIGASATLCKGILLPYLNKFMAEYPHVTINIESQSSLETADMLESGLLDLGLISKPTSHKSLSFNPIMDIHDIFVASADYLRRLKLREGNDVDIVEKADFMLLNKQNSTRHYINDYLKAHNIELKNTIEVTNMDLLIEFSKIGLGVGCVIKEFVQDELNKGELIEVELPLKITKRRVGFAFVSSNPNPTLFNFLNMN